MDWPVLAASAVLAISVIAVYCRTFSVPLLFDDNPSIENNPTIRHLGTAFWPPTGTTVSGRPILNFSLAVNYALSGTHVWSYHALNLAIHVLAGLTLFGILRHAIAGRAEAAALAFSGALLWALHPLQTESVTYIAQRAESLMGLLYLLTLYGFIRGAEAGGTGGRPWFAFSTAACLLGMGTKEVMVAAPIVVLLYDRTFLAGAFRRAWRLRRGPYLALASTWLVPLVFTLFAGGKGGTAGLGNGVPWWRYALTQLPAILHYLRLCLWPHPLVFDYGDALVHPSPGLVIPALAVAGLVAATAWALVRRPAIGFLGAAFLLTLAPSSSIVPVVTQTVAEHRMYLPSIAVIVLAAAAMHRWTGRAALPLCLLLAACLGVSTFERNGDYRTEEGIWADTVAKRADNERAHNNLGIAYLKDAGRWDDAIAQFRESLRLNGDYVEARNNLGYALQAVPGRLGDAVLQFREAIRQKPDYADAHYNLANALDSLGRTPEAVAQYREALRLRPDFIAAHCNLGLSLSSLGRSQEAIDEYREALRLKPNDAAILYDLAFELLRIPGHADEAIANLREVVRLQPENAAARGALERLGIPVR
jgi:Flp pilus assembly protein TadD